LSQLVQALVPAARGAGTVRRHLRRSEGIM